MEKAALLNRMYDWVYNKLGHKGIKFLLFLCFFALHTVISSCAYLPSIEPNEFSAAALANMFLGGDWTSAMSRSNYYYGFLQSILYIPVMLVTKDPFVQYRTMVIVNGAVMSFIPVLAYSCAYMLGVKKPWQGLSVAVCTGGWMSCMIHSKFIWNETAAIFLPFLVLYLLLKADTAEKRGTKNSLSVILGAVLGLCYSAHQRLFALIAAVSVTVLLSRCVFKRRSVSLSLFFASEIIFFAGAVFGNYLVQQELWRISDPSLMRNTAENFFAGLSSMLSDGGVGRFFTSLITQIYYYICASWGLGALAFSIFAVVIARFVSSKRKQKHHEKIDPPIFDGGRSVFMLFCVLLTAFMLFISVCYRFGADNFETSQSILLFGRYLDGVIPFTVMPVLVFIYTEELELTEIFGGVVGSGAIYLLFFLTGRTTVLNASSAAISPMLCLYPAMFGESSSSLITSTGLLAAVSCSMCLMAIFIVIVSCAKKLKRIVISGAIAILSLYSVLFGALYYLPMAHTESVDKNSEYEELSSHIFNSSEAPSVTAYGCSRDCVMMLQYLNQNITVYTVNNTSDIREDTFIIVSSELSLSFEGQERVVLVQLAETDGYRIYAYGERAKAYAQAQSGGDQNNGEETETAEPEPATAPEITIAPPTKS